MRKLMPILLGGLLIMGCATTTEATREQMTHEYIIEYPSIEKDKLFERSMQWIANNFQSAKQVLEYTDKEAGKIVGNGTTDLKAEKALIGVDLHFTLNIDIKDEKIRYRFINLWYNIGEISTHMPPYQKWHRPARIKFDNIISNMKAHTLIDDDF